MAKYEVVKPWHGVKAGDVVEIKTLHPALKPNVRALPGDAGQLVPAVAQSAPGKGDIAKRLKELGIKFDGRGSLEDLQALLPEGDPLKPKAE
nr:hypothetical protein [Gammaproteobacteria bacterium]